jgi:hypothetical protein
MSNQEEHVHLKTQLDQLLRRKHELATMCRIAELAEIKANIHVLREKIEAALSQSNQNLSISGAE